MWFALCRGEIGTLGGQTPTNPARRVSLQSDITGPCWLSPMLVLVNLCCRSCCLGINIYYFIYWVLSKRECKTNGNFVPPFLRGHLVFMFNTEREGASSRCHLYSWSKEGWCGRWEMMVGEDAALQLPAQESTNPHNLKYRRDSSMHRGIGLLHYM